jgi:hypothetical protein
MTFGPVRSRRRRLQNGSVALTAATLLLPLGCSASLGSRGGIFGSPLPASPLRDSTNDDIWQRLGRLFMAEGSTHSPRRISEAADSTDGPTQIDT